MNKHIFVYGTLMKNYHGYKPFSLSDLGTYICNAFVYGRLYEVDVYPGFLPGDNEKEKVFGEIFLLNDFDSTILILDEYEDFYPEDQKKSLYNREIIKVYSDKKDVQEAWAYVFLKEVDEEKRIVSGNYLDFN